MDAADSTKNANQPSNKRKTHSEAQAPTPRRTRPKTNFTERPGGDLTLESSDGMKFNVHSVILSVASPVFASMFELAGSGTEEVLGLEETGEMLNLMLQFIYPKKPPTIPSFDVLDKALRIADKYELDGMYQQLRQTLLTSGSPVSAYADPLSAFSTASSHDLKEEAEFARSLAHGTYDFATVDDLMKLAQTTFASRWWISLIGIPNVISKAISDVLFNFHKKPMLLSGAWVFVCKRCKESLDDSGDHYSPPEWQARWAHAIAAELKKRQIQDWKPCFDHDFLHETVGRHVHTPLKSFQGPCTCLKDIARVHPSNFLAWSSKVHVALMERLAGLDELEKLVK